MIVTHQQMQKETREKMRGGTGAVNLTHLMPESFFYGHGRLYALVTLEPGCSIGWHEHHGESESFHIISGTALLSDNGTPVTLYAGDCAVCPDGEGHSIENCGETPLQFVAMVIYSSDQERV